MEDLKFFKILDIYNQLSYQICDDTFFHSHIFICDDFYTQQNFIQLVGQTLLCQLNCACGECLNCVKVNANCHPDLKLFGEKKGILTDDSKIIIEQLTLKPMLADKKVFIIYNFDKATVSAQNKLLKAIEEPLPDIFFLLGASSEDGILPTIKSRSKVLLIPPFTDAQFEDNIKQMNLKYDADFAKFALNYIGKYKNLIQDGHFKTDYDFIINLNSNLKMSKDVLEYSNKFAESKQTFIQKLQILDNFYEDVLKILIGKSDLIKNIKLINQMKIWASEWTPAAISEALKIIDKSKRMFESNVNLNAICDNMLMEILEVKYLCKKN